MLWPEVKPEKLIPPPERVNVGTAAAVVFRASMIGNDLKVKAVLIAANECVLGCWRITSDGFDFEWRQAQAFASEILDRNLDLPEGVESNWMMKDQCRSGPLYERAKERYMAANYQAGAGPDLWRYGPQEW